MKEMSEAAAIVRRLRTECPWDREQTHRSLGSHLIEESYEVLEAIESGDPGRLRDELGDLLLQVLFHATIAEAEGRFGLPDVASALSAKLVARHPHVFGGATADDPAAVKRQWERLKLREGRASALDGLPPGLPALLAARRMQEKASAVGFDWTAPEQVRAKVAEETAELDAAVAAGDAAQIASELGDLLFAIVNYSRFLRVDPEEALRGSSAKFRRRFVFVEEGLRAAGRSPGDATPEEMNGLWERSKESG